MPLAEGLGPRHCHCCPRALASSPQVGKKRKEEAVEAFVPQNQRAWAALEVEAYPLAGAEGRQVASVAETLQVAVAFSCGSWEASASSYYCYACLAVAV